MIGSVSTRFGLPTRVQYAGEVQADSAWRPHGQQASQHARGITDRHVPPTAQTEAGATERGVSPEERRSAPPPGEPRKDGANGEAQSADELSADELSADDQKEVQRLQKRDAEVRQHEQAHAAAGGAHAGAPKYEYETGPDGKRYAVGGEVPIDVSPVQGDPGATIQKMQQVLRAALAPAQPSGPDRNIAAGARAKLARAQAEMRKESSPEESEDGGAGMRAASAYAKAGAADVPTSTIQTMACESCGGAHSP